MKILIMTKNSIVGNGLALELCSMGHTANFHGSVFHDGYDLYIIDKDTCAFEEAENTLTFSRLEGNAHLKRPFLTSELVSLIDQKKQIGITENPKAMPEEEFDRSCLSETEAKLLDALLERRGSAVSAEELSQIVWGRESIKSNIVNVYIRYLRQKLERDSAKRIIFTVRGQGYKIN